MIKLSFYKYFLQEINKNIEDIMRERAGQFMFKHGRQVLGGKSKTIKKN